MDLNRETDGGNRAVSPLWPVFAALELVSKLGFILVFTALLAGVVGYGSYLIINKKVRREESSVPVLVKEDVTSALQELKDLGLSLELDYVEYGAESPVGTIINQRPEPETTVKKGTPVRVTLSGGPVNVPIPDLKGLSMNDAKVRLEKADLKPGEITSVPDMQTGVGAVLATEPPAGTDVVRFAKVNLLVSIGPPPEELSMPRLTGRTTEQAQDLFSALGLNLTITDVQMKQAPEMTPGVIIDQTPKAGTRVRPGAAVMVTVAQNQAELF